MPPRPHRTDHHWKGPSDLLWLGCSLCQESEKHVVRGYHFAEPVRRPGYRLLQALRCYLLAESWISDMHVFSIVIGFHTCAVSRRQSEGAGGCEKPSATATKGDGQSHEQDG